MTKPCAYCGGTIPTRAGESPYNYQSRVYCDRTCMSRGESGSRKMSARFWPTEAAWALDTSEPQS